MRLKLFLKLAALGIKVSRTNLGLPENGHFLPDLICSLLT